jgi:autotransporter-associated beta strand protein
MFKLPDKILTNQRFILLVFILVLTIPSPDLNADNNATTEVRWATWDEWITGYPRTGTAGTHYGVDPSSNMIELKGLNAAGNTGANLTADATADTTYNGDLIELGFFMDLGNDDAVGGTGSDADSASTTMFKGTWTPITSKTTIGQNFGDEDNDGDPYTIDDIGAGEFSFLTRFTDKTGAGSDNTKAITNPQGGPNEELIFTDTPTNLSTNINLLYDAAASGSPLIGIRFYDIDSGGGGGLSKTNGITRYNTIMDAAWVWPGEDGGTLNMTLHETDGTENDSVQFEFTNSAYNSLSDIGTGGTHAVGDNNYTATVTYFSGSGVLNLDNTGGIGDTVLSGLDSTGTQALGEINVGDDNNTLTIHANAGNAYDFNGTIRAAGGGAGQASILKTGAGEQILTGAVNLDGASSGFVDIYEGTLTFNPDSAGTQSIEYLTSTDDSDAGTTPILKLDNTSAGTGEILEIGLSNVSSAKTFNGNVELSGANSARKIKIGTTDYTDEQIITGTITSGNNAMTLIKDGAGKLTLHGDSTSTMGAGITIDDGTLIIGDGSDGGADPGSGTITINKGKLEVAANESIDNTINGGTSNSKKSIVGGDGTIAALTVGSANGEVDVVSPGQGISSSLTETTGLSNQQVTLGTSSAAAAMGDLTITNLTINDGAIFDWEINDFSSSAGTGWDVLRFDSLVFDSDASASGLINIFSVANNGTAGAVSNMSLPANGVLFLDSIDNDHNDINWGGISGVSSGSWQEVDWMGINDNGFSYHNDQYGGAWNVWYNGSGDFYLRYSAVPEPSTYIMVTGLLMLPGFRMFRRFMKKAKPEDSSVDA